MAGQECGRQWGRATIGPSSARRGRGLRRSDRGPIGGRAPGRSHQSKGDIFMESRHTSDRHSHPGTHRCRSNTIIRLTPLGEGMIPVTEEAANDKTANGSHKVWKLCLHIV